jgi:hypothetical protein
MRRRKAQGGYRAPEFFCEGCERMGPHDNLGPIVRDGLTHSHIRCKECGLEKIGGRIVTSPEFHQP